MTRVVIFDVDGTLVDTVALHAQAWRDTFLQFGKDVPAEKILPQIGKGGDQLVPVFFSQEEQRRHGKALDAARDEIYQTRYLPKSRPFPKVRELFEALHQRGMRLVLASSAKDPELKHYKALLNIDPFLSGETSADDAEHSKPEPDIFIAAWKKLGEPPLAESLVIGDSPYDAEAAAKAGIRAAGVLSGGFSAEWLTEAGCLELFRDPADLLDRLETSPLFKQPSFS